MERTEKNFEEMISSIRKALGEHTFVECIGILELIKNDIILEMTDEE